MAKVRDSALNIARAEMHGDAREVGGNNRGKWVRKYLAGAGLEEGLPWCASFVSWCYREAADTLGIPQVKYCPSARRLYAACAKKGWKVETPLPGDLVFWTRGPMNRGLGHVGFVEYAHDGLMQTIEGNHTSKVERFKYERESMPRLLGFIRVDEQKPTTETRSTQRNTKKT